MTASELLIRGARIVGAGSAEPVDIRLHGDRVVAVGRSSDADADADGARVIDADGRWAIPGLWDHHVHMTQWAETNGRLDLSASASAADAVSRVAAHVADLSGESGGADGSGGAGAVFGAGFRLSGWSDRATVAALDAVTGDRPVALVSGDCHSGWLNTAALHALGLPSREGVLDEDEWFALVSRLSELDGTGRAADARLTDAIRSARSRGVVGITDFEFGGAYRSWTEFAGRGMPQIRVRAGFYEAQLDDVLAQGLRTGDALAPLVDLGPLKIISDGSLGTLTAYCCEPYGDDVLHPRGKQNATPDHLRALLSTAHRNGLSVALHAIGDAAAADALDAFEATGARGSIEHAQLMRHADVGRLAALGLTASVQPAHLVDDRAVTHQVWADRADRSFLFGSMQRAGVRLALGSDAPVAPLDPWLAIDAAVHRAAPGDDAWNPAESLTPAQALFASTDGQGPIGVGSRGDVVLLDDDPLTVRPCRVRVAVTVLAGAPVFDAVGELAPAS